MVAREEDLYKAFAQPCETENDVSPWHQLAAEVFSLATPIWLDTFLWCFRGFTNTLFIGKTGRVPELAAVGLGNVVLSAVGLTISRGLVSGLLPLCGAAAEEDRRLRAIYLQRSRVVVTLMFIITAPVLFFAEKLLVAVGQDAQVSAYAGQFNRASLIGLWFCYQFECVRCFLQGHMRYFVSLRIQGVTCLLHVVWSYLLIIEAGLGNQGAAYANSATFFLEFLLISGYLAREASAMGFSSSELLLLSGQAFQGLGHFVLAAIPSTIQTCAEGWLLEALTFVAGYLGQISLAAFVISSTIAFVALMPAIGLALSVSIMTGSLLAVNKPRSTLTLVRVGIACQVAVWVALGTCMFTAARQLAHIFISNPDVLNEAVKLLKVYFLCGFFDVLQMTQGSVLRGMNWLLTVSSTTLLINFGFTLPLGVFLALHTQVGVCGLFVAGTVGAALQSFTYFLISSQISWSEVAFERWSQASGDSSDDPALL